MLNLITPNYNTTTFRAKKPPICPEYGRIKTATEKRNSIHNMGDTFMSSCAEFYRQANNDFCIEKSLSVINNMGDTFMSNCSEFYQQVNNDFSVEKSLSAIRKEIPSMIPLMKSLTSKIIGYLSSSTSARTFSDEFLNINSFFIKEMAENGETRGYYENFADEIKLFQDIYLSCKDYSEKTLDKPSLDSKLELSLQNYYQNKTNQQ